MTVTDGTTPSGTMSLDTGFSAGSTAMTGGTDVSTDKANQLTTLANNYNGLMAQIDQISADATYNGVNLLNGNSLTATFNAKGTSSLTITGVDFTSGSNGLNISGATKDTITGMGSSLDKATSTLRTQSSTFGSNLAVIQNRQDFTKNTIDNLQAGASDLTLADTNQEGANLLALQTRQSLATTALSLSNRAESSILSILR